MGKEGKILKFRKLEKGGNKKREKGGLKGKSGRST
jgi:hypothetical protein